MEIDDLSLLVDFVEVSLVALANFVAHFDRFDHPVLVVDLVFQLQHFAVIVIIPIIFIAIPILSLARLITIHVGLLGL